MKKAERVSVSVFPLTHTYSEGSALLDDGGQLREADVHRQVPRLPVENKRKQTHQILTIHMWSDQIFNFHFCFADLILMGQSAHLVYT